MLILLSPAKNLNFDPLDRDLAATEPRLLDDAKILAARAKKLSKAKIKTLMELSDDLAALNHERFQRFSEEPRPEGAKPAMFAFNGDVYQGLEAKSLTDAEIARAQDRIRILSGLYGVLRPLDLIQPYRLEMGRKLKNPRGEDLYDFWRGAVAERLRKDLDEAGGERVVLNLASNEYFGAVDVKALDAAVITPKFQDEKDGKLRTLSFFAKKARGAMARFALREGVRAPADLKNFAWEGYGFRPDLSGESSWLFTRAQPARKAA